MTKVITYLLTVSCTTLLLISVDTNAQTAKFDLSAGNDAFAQGDYETALAKYNDALAKNPNYTEAEFNVGNTYYRQQKMEEAVREFRRIAKNAEDETTRAKAYHNLGNSYLQSQKLKEAIEAYKNALRINPNDHETRYNLAVAKKLLEQNPQQQEQQQNQDQQNKDQEQNEDKQENQDKKEGDNKEDQQNKENEEDKDGENKDDENQKNQEEEQQDGQPKEGEMSKEDAERLLQMLEDEEKETQEDLKKKKVKVKKVQIEKDW